MSGGGSIVQLLLVYSKHIHRNTLQLYKSNTQNINKSMLSVGRYDAFCMAKKNIWFSLCFNIRKI